MSKQINKRQKIMLGVILALILLLGLDSMPKSASGSDGFMDVLTGRDVTNSRLRYQTALTNK